MWFNAHNSRSTSYLCSSVLYEQMSFQKLHADLCSRRNFMLPKTVPPWLFETRKSVKDWQTPARAHIGQGLGCSKGKSERNMAQPVTWIQNDSVIIPKIQQKIRALHNTSMGDCKRYTLGLAKTYITEQNMGTLTLLRHYPQPPLKAGGPQH